MQIWRSRAVGSSEGQVPQGWCHGPLGQVLSKLCLETKLTITFAVIQNFLTATRAWPSSLLPLTMWRPWTFSGHITSSMATLTLLSLSGRTSSRVPTRSCSRRWLQLFFLLPSWHLFCRQVCQVARATGDIEMAFSLVNHLGEAAQVATHHIYVTFLLELLWIID